MRLPVGLIVFGALIFSSSVMAQEEQRKYPELCYDANNIARCMKTCEAACNDPDFQFASVKSAMPYDAPCDRLRRTPRNKRVDAPECSQLRQQSGLTCLDETEKIETLEARVDRMRQDLMKEIEEIEKDESLSEEEKQDIIAEYKDEIKQISSFYSGLDAWKCANIPAPKMGGREAVTIGSPKALNFYYRQCLGGVVKKLRSSLNRVENNYQDMRIDQKLCGELDASRLLIMKRDKRKARILKVKIKRMKKYFVSANQCMQSIIKWLDGRTKLNSALCQSKECKQGWEVRIRKLRDGLEGIKKEQAQIGEGFRQLDATVNRIVEVLNYAISCD